MFLPYGDCAAPTFFQRLAACISSVSPSRKRTLRFTLQTSDASPSFVECEGKDDRRFPPSLPEIVVTAMVEGFLKKQARHGLTHSPREMAIRRSPLLSYRLAAKSSNSRGGGAKVTIRMSS